MPLLSILLRVRERVRRQRMARLLTAFPIRPEWRVLDVGGTIDLWLLCPVRPRLVLLNMPRGADSARLPGVEIVYGDGTSLPFADQSFDLVFSNSVIEHVGDATRQARFAAEIERVAPRCWVQTPDRWFPIEAHLWTPFIHFLPRRWQRFIVPRFSIWQLLTRCSPDQRQYYLDHYLDEIRLLSATDIRRLFAGATILQERFLGLSKSIIAIGGRTNAPSVDASTERPT